MELCCSRRAPPVLLPHRHLRPPFTPTSSLPFLPRPASAFSSGKALPARSTLGIIGGFFFPSPGFGSSKGSPSHITLSFSEETSTIVSGQFETAPDGTGPLTVEETSYETISTQEEVPVGGGEEGGPMEFLNKIDLKLDSEDTYYILIYGTGALFALWITSAIIRALDSVPLLPKVMEIIGLGVTVWFSARYLIFKKNRDELFAQIESLKEEIIGSADD